MSISYFEIINEGDDVRVTIHCEKCRERQAHTLELAEVIYDLDLEWEE